MFFPGHYPVNGTSFAPDMTPYGLSMDDIYKKEMQAYEKRMYNYENKRVQLKEGKLPAQNHSTGVMEQLNSIRNSLQNDIYRKKDNDDQNKKGIYQNSNQNLNQKQNQSPIIGLSAKNEAIKKSLFGV